MVAFGAMPWEIIVQSPDTGRVEIDIKPGKSTLGRIPEHDIVIADEAASRTHAILELDDRDQLLIRDAGSTNGTFVNGRQISNPQPLSHNDQIRIGVHVLTVISKGAPPTPGRWTGPVAQAGEYESLLIRSLDHHSVLLHNLSIQLSRIQSMAEVQRRIAAFLGQMLNADKCGVAILGDLDSLVQELGSAEVVERLLQVKSPLLLSGETGLPPLRPGVTSAVLSPVLIDQEVAAIIYAVKDQDGARPFEDLDRLLVVGVSHHAAMAIQRLKYEQALMYSANFDVLTGLPNRKLFLERLARAIARAKRHSEYGFAVFFIDANNFKLVNDSLGHQLGDDVLREIGARLKSNFRELDTVARFGGDEFAILVDGVCSVEEVMPLAQRMLETAAEPISLQGHEFVIQLSVGIAMSSTGYDYPEEAMRDADIAMYKSKENGGDNFRIYDRVMHTQLMNSLKLQTDLRNAYKQNEFVLHYQPILALDTGEVRGFEALLRWHSPDRGLVTPDHFFASINPTGPLNMLETWVVRTACAQIAHWNTTLRRSSPLFMSVNLSIKQLDNPELLRVLQSALDDFGVNPDWLWLELSEKSSIGEGPATLPLLKSIRSMGLHLCLDDFGTGYSTLGYLSRLPIDVLKIDRSLVSEGNTNPESTKIIHTVVGLADNLGLQVVAEGVETELQLQVLKASRCKYAQGYYFSVPLEPAAAAAMLAGDHPLQEPAAG